MAAVFNCGFNRTAVKHSVYDENCKVVHDKKCRLGRYSAVFWDLGAAFSMQQAKFSKESALLLGNFAKWRGDDKTQHMKHFTAARWMSLPDDEKAIHAVSSCEACEMYHLRIQTMFPAKGSDAIQACIKAARNGYSKAKGIKLTRYSRKEAAPAIYAAAKKVYKETFEVDLSKTLMKVPELQLRQEKSKGELEALRRAQARDYKAVIESQWAKVDCDGMLCSRQSSSQRDLRRKTLHFESHKIATFRTRKRKALEKAATRKNQRLPAANSWI